jgi:hypothetical protein
LTRHTWKIVAWGAFAYFWSLINDDPLNADRLLEPYFGHIGYYYMEIFLNLSSLVCFCLASREALKGRSAPGTSLKVALLTLVAFLWSSADDIPFLYRGGMETLKTQHWYPFDIAIHAVSLIFFYLAVRESKTSNNSPSDPRKVHSNVASRLAVARFSPRN